MSAQTLWRNTLLVGATLVCTQPAWSSDIHRYRPTLCHDYTAEGKLLDSYNNPRLVLQRVNELADDGYNSRKLYYEVFREIVLKVGDKVTFKPLTKKIVIPVTLEANGWDYRLGRYLIQTQYSGGGVARIQFGAAKPTPPSELRAGYTSILISQNEVPELNMQVESRWSIDPGNVDQPIRPGNGAGIYCAAYGGS